MTEAAHRHIECDRISVKPCGNIGSGRRRRYGLNPLSRRQVNGPRRYRRSNVGTAAVDIPWSLSGAEIEAERTARRRLAINEIASDVWLVQVDTDCVVTQLERWIGVATDYLHGT